MIDSPQRSVLDILTSEEEPWKASGTAKQERLHHAGRALLPACWRWAWHICRPSYENRIQPEKGQMPPV
jgi:hypothetical protein